MERESSLQLKYSFGFVLAKKRSVFTKEEPTQKENDQAKKMDVITFGTPKLPFVDFDIQLN
ncbi:MAG: hypothetical protein ACI33P_08430 [Lysinibacillus sp.]